MKCLTICASLFFLISCIPGENQPGDGNGDVVSTELSGVAFLDAALQGASVEIVDTLADGATVPGSESTDEAGVWKAELGPRYGSFLVKVTGSSSNTPKPLSAFVENVESDEKRTNIPVTPFTHLAYEFQRYLVGAGLTGDAALEKSRRLVYEHFGGLALSGVVPVDLRLGAATSLSDGVKAGILAGGLRYLAQNIATDQGLQPQGLITTGTLVAALAEDISADGLFDGQGPGAQALSLEGYHLSEETLRSEYALAINDFLRSLENTSVFGPDDFASVTGAIGVRETGIFPSGAGGFDPDAPVITFESPAHEDFVRGAVSIVIHASDESEIDSLVLSGSQWLVIEEPNAGNLELRAELDSLLEEEGPLTLSAEAIDVYGNRSTASITVTVNNVGPVITVVAPVAESTVAGEISIIVTAEDAQGVASLAVTDPTVGDLDPARDRFEAVFDTLSVGRDGAFEMQIESEDFGGAVSQETVVVQLDNLAEGTISGVVMLDSAVTGSTVTAYSLDGFNISGPLSLVTLEEGESEFTLPMSDDYWGSVLIMTGGPLASYWDTALNEAADFSDTLGMFTIVGDYTPSGEGTVIENIQVNALTTLVGELASTFCLQDTEQEFATCLDDAESLFAGHINDSETIDVLTQPVRDMTTSESASDPATRLGLFHTGLSRLGAEFAASSGEVIGSVRTPRLVELLRLDLEDGVLDGNDLNGEPIVVTLQDGAPLSVDTLRCHLALAIARFLQNEPLRDGSGAEVPGTGNTNQTGLALSNFATFLSDLCLNDSQLFGGVPGQAFDTMGPVIGDPSIQVAGEELFGNAPILLRGGDVLVSLSAEDDISPMASLTMTLDGQSVGIGDDLAAASGELLVTLNSTALTDGEHVLHFVARDALGNTSILDVTVVIDNTPPVMEWGSVSLVASALLENGTEPPATLYASGSATDATSGVVSVRVDTDEAQDDIVETEDGSFEIQVEVECDREFFVRISAIDAAGNESQALVYDQPGSSGQALKCDVYPPEVAVSDISYRQEFDPSTWEGGAYYMHSNLDNPDARIRAASTLHYDLFEDVEFDPEGPAVLLTKYFNRFDEGAENLPRFYFTVNDLFAGATVQTAASDLAVKVRHSYVGGDETVWFPVEFQSDGGFYFDLSYQKMVDGVLQAPVDTIHTLEVQVSDGTHTSVSTVSFYLWLLAPPVWYGECAATSTLTTSTLANNKLHELFDADDEAVYGGYLRWDLGLQENTAASMNQAILAVQTLAGFDPYGSVSDETTIGRDKEEPSGWISNAYSHQCDYYSPESFSWPGEWHRDSTSFDDNSCNMGFRQPEMEIPISMTTIQFEVEEKSSVRRYEDSTPVLNGDGTFSVGDGEIYEISSVKDNAALKYTNPFTSTYHFPTFTNEEGESKYYFSDFDIEGHDLKKQNVNDTQRYRSWVLKGFLSKVTIGLNEPSVEMTHYGFHDVVAGIGEIEIYRDPTCLGSQTVVFEED